MASVSSLADLLAIDVILSKSAMTNPNLKVASCLQPSNIPVAGNQKEKS